MAHSFDGVVLDELAADPTSPDPGHVWFNTTQGILKARLGGATRAIGAFLGLGIDDVSMLGDDYILRYDVSSQKWKAELLGTSPGMADVQQLAINEKKVSLGTSWQTFGTFIYGGTDTWGTVDQVLILTAMSSDNGARTHDVRLYDVTNGNVISSATALKFSTPTISDLGAVSNLPTGQAIFEVQAKRNGPTFKLDFYSISMKGTI